MKKIKIIFSLFILFCLSLTAQAQNMVLEYNTTKSDGTTITLPLQGTTVDVTVDWGDGSDTENFTSASNREHTYASNGTYTVTISGSLTHFGSSSVKEDKLIRLTNFGTLGITDLYYAFYNAENLIEVPTTLPSGVTNMSKMFSGATSFNGDISSWNVDNVTDMAFMFYKASAFNQNIGSWNVANVANMKYMFYEAFAFNGDISSWKVNKVTDMAYMFCKASAFNQDIGSWNVDKVTDMYAMFYKAFAFNQDIGSWKVDKVTNMSDMFINVTLSTINYDALLNGWSALTLQPNLTFSGGNSKYSCNGEAARKSIKDNYSWGITDGGLVTDVVSINTQPVSKTVCEGTASFNLSVDATAGTALTYQWSDNNGTMSGKTASTLTITTDPANSNTYFCTLGSECADNVKSSDAVVTINATTIVEITAQPEASTIAYIGEADITLSVSGTGTITYQWYKNSTPMSGKTSSTLTIATELANSDTYYCIVGSSCGSNVQSSDAIVTINKANPTFTFEDITKAFGDANFDFVATVNSGGTISYTIEGAANETSLSGTNNATVSIGNAGTVTIRATALATSNYNSGTKDITLTINKANLEATAEDKLKTYGDANPTFTVSYTGFKNGEDKSVINSEPTGATTATATTDVGVATITLTGGSDNNYTFSPLNSGVFTITAKPITVTVHTGQTKVYGAADPVFAYDGTPLLNADTYTGALSRTVGEAVGTYAITIGTLAASSNYSITFESNDFEIIVMSPTATTVAASGLGSTAATLNGTVDDNGAATTVTFEYGTTTGYGTSVTASPGSLSAGSGSTVVTKALTGLTPRTTYHYRVKGVNSAGTTVGSDLTFTTNCIEPDIPTVSGSGTFCANTGNKTLSIASGNLNSATDWQWYTNSCGGTPAGNGTSISINPNITTTYYVRGEGGCITPGTCYSTTITINPITEVTTQPTASTTACQGDADLTLSVSASGTGTLSYQWYKGSTLMSGKTSSTLTIATNLANSDTYYCIVGNGCGNAVQSSNAVVTINDATEITTQPVSQNVETGTNVTFTVVAKGTNLIYQWQKLHQVKWHKNKNNLSGETNSSLVLSSITANDASTYDCFIKGDCGEIYSEEVSLTTTYNSSLEYIGKTVFSPNGDGKNDVWIAPGGKSYPNYKLYIYNSLGKTIYSSNSYNNDWDGTHNGTKLPSGSSYFFVFIKGNEVIKGTIAIVY